MKIVNSNKEKEAVLGSDQTSANSSSEQEIIIHVMPSQSTLSGVTYGDSANQHGTASSGVKKIGLAIFISGGIIIIALIYFGYRYLIAPSLQTNDAPITPITVVTPPPPPSQPTPPPSEPIIIDIPEEPEIIIPIDEIEDPVIDDPFNIIPIEDPGVSLLTVSFVDRDNDGLSDLAEEFIGTNPLNPDSDGDGYSDYEEMMNDYNPLGAGRLPDNFPAIKYQVDKISFFYPRDWEIQTIDNNVWLMSAPDSSMIQLSRRENETQVNIFSWYANEFGTSDPIPNNRILRSGLGVGILSEDGKIVYFASPDLDYIFVVSYFTVDADFNHFSALALFLDTLNYQ